MARGLQAEDGSDERGLATAIGPQECNEVASMDIDGDVFKDVLAVELDAQVLDADDGIGHEHFCPIFSALRLAFMTLR